MFAAFNTLEHRQKSYAMHTIKITPNLIFEYQCTSGKFIRLLNRIEYEKNRFGSYNRIESNRKFFFPNWNALAIVPVSKGRIAAASSNKVENIKRA